MLIFRDEFSAVKSVSTTSGYDGLEKILEAIDKAESGWTQREHRTGNGADASYHEGELGRVGAAREGEHRMITVIGVRFRTAGKIYYFDPAGRLD